MLGDVKDFLFFDIEVFPQNSMVVFKNYEGETVRVFSSSLDGLGHLWGGIVKEEGYGKLEDFVRGKTLVGYNNYFYDDYILYAMSKNLEQHFIKEWNDAIIKNGSKVGMKKIEVCHTLDTFQQIDISKPSLKRIEGNMGKSIIESPIEFDIDRPLKPEELKEVLEYCEYDVLQTIEVFKMRADYFESKGHIIQMLPAEYQEMAWKWNTTSIVGQILKPNDTPDENSPPATRNGRLVDDDLMNLVPLDVQTMWRELDSTQDFNFKQKKVVISEFDCDIEFGWGGLHGAPKGVKEYRNIVKLYDVESMYPSILIKLEGLGNKTRDYEEILNHRLKLKKQNLKKEQAPFKLILNSTYGLLNNQYSALNKPHLAYSICIYGQISLYVLCQKLVNVGCKIININTDGVAFEPYANSRYADVVEDWEETFGLRLEESGFRYWRQTNVNNYVAETDSGQIKVKGGDVNNYHDYDKGGRNYYFNNANTRIVHKAVVEKILGINEIDITITENRRKPELFQYILRAGGTYQGTFDNHGNKLQNVNRVFAGKNTGYELSKKRMDGGLVKFPDAPKNMFVFNEDLSKLDDFEKLIDLQWYLDLAYKVYERWKL